MSKKQNDPGLENGEQRLMTNREKETREICKQIIEEAKKIKEMGYGNIPITCDRMYR